MHRAVEIMFNSLIPPSFVFSCYFSVRNMLLYINTSYCNSKSLRECEGHFWIPRWTTEAHSFQHRSHCIPDVKAILHPAVTLSTSTHTDHFFASSLGQRTKIKPGYFLQKGKGWRFWGDDIEIVLKIIEETKESGPVVDWLVPGINGMAHVSLKPT